MASTRNPGQRAGLTRRAVLDAARELLGEGLGSVTMRAVAGRLGVAPNALYSHVENRTALVDALLDDVLGAVEVPATEDPREGLLGIMTSTWDVLVARPDLVPAYLARQGARGENARALGAAMIALLARGGVHGAAAEEAVRVLIVHTLGFAALGTAPDAPLRPEELRANLVTGLGWLLTGTGLRPCEGSSGS